LSPETAPEYTVHNTDSEYDPFLPLRPISRPKSSDEEYVGKIAKSLQWWDRWRWLAILLHVAILGVVIWFGFRVVALVDEFHRIWGNQNQNLMPRQLVLIGIILGLKVGFFFYGSLMSLINAVAGFRSERLLVQYFNQLQSKADDPNGTSYR
jgi:hypothetical protein